MLYKHLKKSLHYTYKTNELPVCYNLTAKKLYHTIHAPKIAPYISHYKPYFELHDYKTNP